MSTRTILSRIQIFAVALVVAASMFVAALARAEGMEADVRVRVIHAQNGAKRFDRALTDLRKYLDRFPYSSYKQVIDTTMHLGVSDQSNTKGIGLLAGKNLNVTLVALTKEKATIRLLLVGQAGQMLDTTISAGPHKLFFIAGPRYDGGVLFIAIEPHYDPEKLNAGNFVDNSKATTPH